MASNKSDSILTANSINKPDSNNNIDTTTTTTAAVDPGEVKNEINNEKTNQVTPITQQENTSEVAAVAPSKVKILASLAYVCEKTSKGKWNPIQSEDINIDISEKIQKLKNEKKIIALCYFKNDHFEPVNKTSDININSMSPQFSDVSSDLLDRNDKYEPPIQDLEIDPENLKGKKKYEYWVSHLNRGVQITRNNITLRINDLEDLVHRELTSSIINFYLKLLEGKIKDKKYYIFNTFFFTELIKDSKNIELAAVNSWSQSKGQEFNPFEFDKIFVPIHRKERHHWVLAIINLKEKRFEYCDSANYQDNFFSSIARPALQFYMEHKQRQHILKIDTSKIIDFKRFDEYNLNSALQQNGIDCGVFVCNYIDCIITAKDFVETEGSFSFNTKEAYNYRFYEIAEKIKLILDSESAPK